MKYKANLKPLCIVCGSPYHYQTFCPYRKRKSIKKAGKQTVRWISERKYWIQKNPPDQYGFWYCHYCLVPLVAEKDDPRIQSGQAMRLTIDHIKARSSSPKDRYNHDNLVACCPIDNRLKGSMDYIRFVEKYYPEDLDKHQRYANIKA